MALRINKVFFAAPIAEISNYECNLWTPDPEAKYGVFRQYKNGKTKLLKVYRTMEGARNRAAHRNHLYAERHGDDCLNPPKPAKGAPQISAKAALAIPASVPARWNNPAGDTVQVDTKEATKTIKASGLDVRKDFVRVDGLDHGPVAFKLLRNVMQTLKTTKVKKALLSVSDRGRLRIDYVNAANRPGNMELSDAPYDFELKNLNKPALASINLGELK